MKPLLLHGFGTSVRVNGRTLEIDYGSEARKESYRPQQLPFDSVVVDSLTGSISFEALRFLAIHDVPVTLLRWNGTVLSTVLPRGPSNGDLRIAQIQAYSNSELRLRIAREFIREKVSKTLALAEFLSGTLPVSPVPIQKEAAPDQGRSLNDFRVYEARVAQAWWKEVAKAVESLWPNSGFVSRRSPSRSWNNSAADPTNALLNYGYSLLESHCRGAINRIGLLPEIGFLHETAPSKLPLVYDLQEPFRWLVDLSVLEVIRDGKLDRKADFIVTENYHIRLRPKAAQTLIDRVSANLNRTVKLRSKSISFDSLVTEAARRLSRSLINPKSWLDLGFPFNTREEVYARAYTQNRLHSITYAEARTLGISKAGLWDMKRRVAAGRPVRLYRKTRARVL